MKYIHFHMTMKELQAEEKKKIYKYIYVNLTICQP